MAIDYATPVGQVRLLTADVDEANQVLPDDVLAGYLALRGSDGTTASPAQVKRAAADALDATATSEALVSKTIHTQDLTTDGTKVAAALRAHAAQLRADADRDDADQAAAAGLDDAWFGVAEFNPYTASGAGEGAERGWA